MTKREIMTVLIKEKKIPERMGVCEDFWPETVQITWPEKGIPKDRDPTEYYDLDMVDLMEYWRGWRFALEPFYSGYQTMEEDDFTHVYKDGWGATVRRFKKTGGPPEHIDFELTSRKIWEQKFREPLLVLDTARFGDIDSLRERYTRYKANGFFTMYNNTFVFENLRYSMGDVAMLENMYDDPVWIKDFCDVFTSFTIKHLEYIFQEVGIPDAYTIYDDMAYTTSCFCSPGMYRELITPYHKRLVDFLKSYGIGVILHSCGKIDQQMENIIAAGIDCIQPLEAKTGMDISAMAEACKNKIVFMGNIDIRALEKNRADAIEQEILPKLKKIRENRIPYIFHTDHSVSPLVDVSSYEYALNLFRENCQY